MKTVKNITYTGILLPGSGDPQEFSGIEKHLEKRYTHVSGPLFVSEKQLVEYSGDRYIMLTTVNKSVNRKEKSKKQNIMTKGGDTCREHQE